MQSCINNNTGSGTTLTCSLSSTVGANDLIVGIASWGSSATNIFATTTDSGSASYQYVQPQNNSIGLSSQVFWTCAAASAGSDTITITWSSSVPFRQVNAVEYSGLTSTKCKDTSAQTLQTTGGTTADSGSAITTFTPNDLLVGLFTNFDGFGWTAGNDGQGDSYVLKSNNTITGIEAVNVTSAKSYKATATLSSSTEWMATFIAFRTTAYSPKSADGRYFDGQGDFLRATTQFFHTAYSSGTFFFKLNLRSLPTAGQLGEIFNIVYQHFDQGCTSVSGTCVDIFNTGPSPPHSYTANQINIDFTTPNVAEYDCWYASPSTGLHSYIIDFNLATPVIHYYLDGALQTATSCSGSNPGPVAVIGPIGIMGANSLGTGNAGIYFANGTISDIGIWNLQLNAGDRNSLLNGVPANRVRPENSLYIPIYGVDSPEPGYTTALGQAGVAAQQFTVVQGGPTPVAPGNRVGGQPGGAYAP